MAPTENDPLIPKNQCVDPDPLPPECMYKFYTLPFLRFITVVKVLIFIDAVSVTILWLCGGNSVYFIDNILHFHMKQSVFDLALLSGIKSVLLIALFTSLEDVSLQLACQPNNNSLHKRKSIFHFSVIFLTLAPFVYATVKGSLMLYAHYNDGGYQWMHPTYNAAVICSVIFSFLELILAFLSFGAMRRLRVMRVLHRVNEKGQEIDKDGNPIKKKVDLKRLASLARPEAGLITIAIICLFISSAAQTAAPLFFGFVIDAAQRTMADLNYTVVVLLLIYVGGSVASMFRSWLFTLAGQRLVARLRKDLFQSIISQEIAFFDTTRTGELTNRLASDTQVIQNAITVNVSMLSRYLVQILGSLILMFILNASLTGVLLAVVPVVSIGAVQYGMFVKKLRKDFQDRLADASTTAEESISSMRTVRSFVGENRSSSTYGVDIDKSYAVGKKMALIQGAFDGTVGMVAYGSIVLVLWYGGKLVHDGVVTPGLLTSFLLYTLQVAMAFALLSSLYGDFMQAVGASIRVFDLLDRVPIVSNEGGRTLISLEAAVQFENVHFTYPSRPDTIVLKDVSFTVEQGQMVALVGPSGGGKSTIVSLIERFYDVDSGTIRLGGDDIRQLDPQWFRRQIALVSQEPTLFACSIKENIAYGREATEAEITEAARQSNAHEFITSFEDSYDTLVGERGVRLSGGQKQRVAIARALIMNPAILLLDEATSALDAESEHLVQEAIDRAMVNRTVVVIAHRLSTVRNASKVIVIDKGRIVEEGKHDELLAKNGVYKKLIMRQLMAGSGGIDESNDNNALLDMSTEEQLSSRHSPVGNSGDLLD